MADKGIVHALGAPFQYPQCIADTQKEKDEKTIVPILDKTMTVKNLAQSLLGVIWFIQGIPKVVKLIPSNVEAVLSNLEWISFLKPFEKALAVIKSIGNVLEFPERLILLRKASGEWTTNRWKAVYRYTSAFYIGMEALILAPLKWGVWNILAIGGWAAKVGVTPFGLTLVRDAFTAGSSAINVVAEGKNRDKAYKLMTKYTKRNEKDGTLDSLKGLLDPKQTVTQQVLDKIDEVKKKHWANANKDKNDSRKLAQKDIDALTKRKDQFIEKRNDLKLTSKEVSANEQEIQKLDQLIQFKREKLARMDIWEKPATAANLDKLRNVVVYKISKNEVHIANNQMTAEKCTVTRWYDITKCAVVIFTNMITLGVAAVVAPAIGLSAATVAGFFLLGQWITGLGCGLSGLAKCAAMLRYAKNFALPQTQLLRA